MHHPAERTATIPFSMGFRRVNFQPGVLGFTRLSRVFIWFRRRSSVRTESQGGLFCAPQLAARDPGVDRAPARSSKDTTDGRVSSAKCQRNVLTVALSQRKVS